MIDWIYHYHKSIMILQVQFASSPDVIYEKFNWVLDFPDKVYHFTCGSLEILDRYHRENTMDWGCFECLALEDIDMMYELHSQTKEAHFKISDKLFLQWLKAHPDKNLSGDFHFIGGALCEAWKTRDSEILNRLSSVQLEAFWPKNKEIEEYCSIVYPSMKTDIETSVFVEDVMHNNFAKIFPRDRYRSVTTCYHLDRSEDTKHLCSRIIYRLCSADLTDSLVKRLKILARTHEVVVRELNDRADPSKLSPEFWKVRDDVWQNFP